MPGNNSRPALTAERLRELLDYDPRTGRMTRRVTRGSNALAGGEAGSINGKGYVDVRVDGRRYRRSRLAWLHVTGAWPTQECDHRNGVKDDDRISNLRDVSRAENNRNARSWNQHGVKGVCFHARKRARPWEASIWMAGKRKSLGYFATKTEAAGAYTEASKRQHGAFAVSRRRAEPLGRLSFSDAKLGDRLFDLSEIMIADGLSETDETEPAEPTTKNGPSVASAEAVHQRPN